MGPSVRQPRRDPRRGRLAEPQGAARGLGQDDHRARRAGLGDQGARDPGRLRAAEFLQPRRPGPRDPGAPGLHRGRHRDAGRHEGRNHHRRLPFVDRQRRAAHLPPRAEHRPAQELGRGRCLPPRRHARAECGGQEGRGLPERAEREDLGLLRRGLQGQGVRVRASLRQLRDGERAVQDLVPGRIPRADRGGMRDAAASAR